MIPRSCSRRVFLKATAGAAVQLAATTPALLARGNAPGGPLMAYVGTFSSPLQDVLPTQVDLPPGNGRGIHLFEADRATGALTPRGVVEMGTSPSCLAFNAAGLLVPASVEPSRLEALAAAPGEPRAAGAAGDDIRIGAWPPLAARAAPRAPRAC